MEESPFISFFGSYPKIRVLDFLLENEGRDFSKTEIAKNANVSFNTLELFWEDMIGSGLVTSTRSVGRSRMYSLNMENPFMRYLREFDRMLLLEHLAELEEEIP